MQPSEGLHTISQHSCTILHSHHQATQEGSNSFHFFLPKTLQLNHALGLNMALSRLFFFNTNILWIVFQQHKHSSMNFCQAGSIRGVVCKEKKRMEGGQSTQAWKINLALLSFLELHGSSNSKPQVQKIYGLKLQDYEIKFSWNAVATVNGSLQQPLSKP